MKKSISKTVSLLAIVTFLAALVASATVSVYFAVSAPAPGKWRVGTGIGQVTHARVSGAVPTNGTVTLAWVNNAQTVTNSAFVTITCTNGAFDGDISGGAWVLAGDYLLRAGSVTNTSECTVIVTGNQ